jgi:hypothetical protein
MRRTTYLIILVSIAVIVFLLLRKSDIVSYPQNGQTVAQANAPTEFKATNSSANTFDATKLTNGLNEFQDIQAHAEQVKQEDERLMALAQSPLLYYGKVVDESNQPIADVQVSYTAHTVNKSREDIFNTGMVKSDGRGIFKIDGINGIGLMLQLSHPNYYLYPDNSTGFDKRSVPRKGYFSDSEEKAELFRMHSKGHPVPLVHRRGSADVPVNGGSASVNFDGTEDSQVIGTLQIEASGNTPKNWSPTPYDWSVRLTMSNGGLIESTNQFDFIAPDVGYQQSIEIDMTKDQQGWSDSVSKSYFVKLSNGYARMEIHIRAKTPLYVSLDYYFNPDGSANLEPDR